MKKIFYVCMIIILAVSYFYGKENVNVNEYTEISISNYKTPPPIPFLAPKHVEIGVDGYSMLAGQDDISVNMRFGYMIPYNFEPELDCNYLKTGQNTDATDLTLDVLYNMPLGEKIAFLLFIGLGNRSETVEGKGKEKEIITQSQDKIEYGFGTRFFIEERSAIRVEYKSFDVGGNKTSGIYFGFSIFY